MNILDESNQRAASPLIIDNFGTRYKITSPILFSFTAPSIRLLEENYYFLLKNSDVKIFESKYKWRPDYLSFDKYGTVILDKLLMYINGVACIEEFDLDKVFIPKMDSISEICGKMKLEQDINDLEVLKW